MSVYGMDASTLVTELPDNPFVVIMLVDIGLDIIEAIDVIVFGAMLALVYLEMFWSSDGIIKWCSTALRFENVFISIASSKDEFSFCFGKKREEEEIFLLPTLKAYFDWTHILIETLIFSFIILIISHVNHSIF